MNITDILYAKKLSGGGGGGGGDFSTAILTIIGHAPGFEIPIASDNYNMAYSTPAQLGENVIILYKGRGYFYTDIIPDSMSGDIEYDPDVYGYVISGDCSVEFSII